MNKTLATHLSLFTANLIYAANYSIAKGAMEIYFDPLGLVLLRVIGAGALYWIVEAIFVSEKVNRSDLFRLCACGLFGVAINQMLFLKGLDLTSPINASLLMMTTPILVLVVSTFLLYEKVTMRKALGIALGMAGAALLITANSDGIELSWVGDIFVFINAASYGLYLVIVKPLMHKYHPLTVIKWVFTFGFCFVVPFGFQPFIATDWTALPSWAIWSASYVVIGTTFVAYLLNVTAVKYGTPTLAATYIYLQPVLAAIIAVIWSTDELNWTKVIASAVIFLGVWLVVSKSRIKSLDKSSA